MHAKLKYFTVCDNCLIFHTVVKLNRLYKFTPIVEFELKVVACLIALVFSSYPMTKAREPIDPANDMI